MAKATKKNNSSANLGFEAKLWLATDKLLSEELSVAEATW